MGRFFCDAGTTAGLLAGKTRICVFKQSISFRLKRNDGFGAAKILLGIVFCHLSSECSLLMDRAIIGKNLVGMELSCFILF